MSGAARRAGWLLTWTLVILYIGWLVDYMATLVITIALPDIGREFHLNNTLLGLAVTVFFITYAPLQVPAGVLADKLGARRSIVAAMTAWSAFTALTGAAVNYVMLLAARLLFGASESMWPSAAPRPSPNEPPPASG